jgi:hypothetical protein
MSENSANGGMAYACVTALSKFHAGFKHASELQRSRRIGMPTASHRRHLVLSDLCRAGFACIGAVTLDVVWLFSVCINSGL